MARVLREISRSVVAFAAVAVVSVSDAAVETSRIFSDNMVLQHGKPLPVWGKADPGEKVTVSFAGQSVEATADGSGNWTVTLKPLDVSKEGRELKVNDKAFKNVVVGDVWLVSGQSNAEMSFSWGILNGDAEMAKAKDFPNIRTVKFSHTTSPYPIRYQTANPFPWYVCTKDTLKGVTAMGYFFARDINERTGIPIGILDDNWSGCRIEPFICAEGLAATKGMEKEVAQYLANLDVCKKWISRTSDGSLFDYPLPFNMNPGYAGQHNAMIEPIVRFPITGALWYQGCSNGGEGMSYAKKLEALIAGWRAKWGCEFPFYIVQLASFQAKSANPAGGDGYAKIRNAMRIAAQTIPKTGLAVAIDIGNGGDIHPKNKLDVGLRLARWARRDVYGEKDLEVSGPLYRAMSVEEGKIRVTFDHVYKGLMVAEKGPDTPGVAPTPGTLEDKLKGFAIAGDDKVWHWAEAEIDGKDVVVWSDEVSEPVAVRYAFRANPMGECNLYNKAGLPASPFRTDAW